MESRIIPNIFLHGIYQEGRGLSIQNLVFGPHQPVGKYKCGKMKGIHVSVSKLHKTGRFAVYLYVIYEFITPLGFFWLKKRKYKILKIKETEVSDISMYYQC